MTKSITLPNGIVMTPDKSGSEYARLSGLRGITVFRSKDKTGFQEYVIVEYDGEHELGTAVFGSQNYEAIGAHLDIMALALKVEAADKSELEGLGPGRQTYIGPFHIFRGLGSKKYFHIRRGLNGEKVTRSGVDDAWKYVMENAGGKK